MDLVRAAAGSGARDAYIVFDRAVGPRAAAARKKLDDAGVRVLGQTGVAGGERCKRLSSVAKLYSDFVAAGASRSTLVVAIGGGTVTDLAGFAAATYLRGVPWVAVATTVLGMVDAAIGGKTGVDLKEGKNLAGSFWQPIAVVGDLGALETLPLRERRTGMAEIVKHGIVGDPGLFRECETFDVGAAVGRWPALISRAAAVKLRIVGLDPLESGVRVTLNLGHTVGHALEFASGFRLSHGAAVAVGLRAAGLLALNRGMWSASAHARVLGALSNAGLDTHAEGISVSAALVAMRRDKKRAGGKHRFVLPDRIGKVIPGIDVREPEIRRVLAQCSRPAGEGERAG
ncbi:MAG TPA: 3-dehydroquinate synthase family protein [Candidatus Eremiobacteraceae bacterium]